MASFWMLRHATRHYSSHLNRQKVVLSQMSRTRNTLINDYSDKILEGKFLAEKIQLQIKENIASLNEINQAKYHDTPVLGYIIVGNKPESELYVRLKRLACEKVGIQHHGVYLPHDSTEQEVINNVDRMGRDPRISGILVQLPMPAHVDNENVCKHIPPEKDVDGLHPFNIGCLAMKN